MRVGKRRKRSRPSKSSPMMPKATSREWRTGMGTRRSLCWMTGEGLRKSTHRKAVWSVTPTIMRATSPALRMRTEEPSLIATTVWDSYAKSPTRREIKKYVKINHLTWHECNNMITMQPILTEVNYERWVANLNLC